METKKLIVVCAPSHKECTFYNFGAGIPSETFRKCNGITEDKYDYEKLDKLIKELKPKKVIFGLGNEPLSKFNTNPYFLMMGMYICRENKVKASIMTEQQPSKHMFLEYFDEVIYFSNSISNYITEQFGTLNFMSNIRLAFRNVREDSLEELKGFRGKITIYDKQKGDGVIPANVRFSSPKSEDYKVLLPNGELVSTNL